MYYLNGAGTGVSIGLDGVAGTGGYAAGDRLTNIENLYGTAFDDTLWGNIGNNVISSDSGNDTILGDAGSDTINGGLGNDTMSYAASASAVTINLALGTASGGDAAGDTLSNIENLIGSSGNDTLIGDTNANSLAGGAGNDTLRGGDGADTLNGGSGTDTADYSDSLTGVTIYLDGTTSSGGTAAGDILISIESIIGSGFDDTINGASSAETLNGGAGNDIIIGGAGGDTIDGGTGTDTVSYASSLTGVTVYLPWAT
jgi:Ca2+-binding RTX toxin-like protein